MAEVGAGVGRAHDVTVSVNASPPRLSEDAFAEDAVVRMRRKVEKAEQDLDAAQVALALAEAALAAKKG